MDTNSITRIENETWEAYHDRVSLLLPNFPIDVLEQWFYEHERAPQDNDFLDYPKLRFTQASFATEDVPGLDCAFDDFLRIDVPRFDDLKTTPRIQRIHEYFIEHGTWPRPVIFLRNHEDNMVTPRGIKIASPFQLIEGHKRMTVFHAIKNSARLEDEHKVWIIDV